MAQIRTTLEIRPAAVQAAKAMSASVLPLLHQAVHLIAQYTASNWRDAVNAAKLWSGDKDAYVKSITWKMVSDFEAEVSSDFQQASEIEDGRPARDLKRMLDTSMKVRMSAKGKRYLIIPFRHNKASMPPGIAAAAAALAPSSVVGMGTRLSGTGAMDIQTRQAVQVAQRKYSWGDKLVGDTVGKRFQGMYRFNTSTPGGGRSSAYLTFRTMVEGSPKWIVPPQPGLHIVANVVADMQPKAQQIVTEAIKRSISV